MGICDVKVQSPEEVEDKKRLCYLELVGDCAKHWKDADIQEKCQAYQDDEEEAQEEKESEEVEEEEYFTYDDYDYNDSETDYSTTTQHFSLNLTQENDNTAGNSSISFHSVEGQYMNMSAPEIVIYQSERRGSRDSSYESFAVLLKPKGIKNLQNFNRKFPLNEATRAQGEFSLINYILNLFCLMIRNKDDEEEEEEEEEEKRT
ncbi:hypothetical protein C0J52_04821 [Blattella germanica]|nr:hypothetical protein C0J52_04821 [Blattella germanica]